MPGLVGCVSEKPINPGLLPAMVRPMLHRTDYSVRSLADERFVCASIDLASGRRNVSGRSEDGRYTLAFFGTLYEPWVSSKETILRVLLARWADNGWSGLANLNGEYLVLVWDGSERTLTVVNDRLGMLRFNYWHNGSTFAWASEVKSLAVLEEVGRGIDEEALTELLTFGNIQENRTLLKSVQSLPPATCLIWQAGQLSMRPYWRIGEGGTLTFPNDDEAVDGFEFHLRQSVARRLNRHSNFGLLLSGGLDSRAIAGAIRSVDPVGPLRSWTSGHGHDHDTQFAKKIARLIGSRHASVNIPEDFLSVYGQAYARLLDGTVAADGCHRAALIAPIQNHAEVLWNGFIGDVLTGSNLLAATLEMDSIDEVIEKGYRYYALGCDESFLAQMMLPEVYSRIRGFAPAAFRKSVLAVESDHPAARLGLSVVIRQLWGDARAQLDLLGTHFRLVTPFSDRDLFDFISRLPLKYRIGRKIYLETLRRKYPELARVPRAGDGLPLIRSRLRESLHWKWLSFERHTLPKWTFGRVGGHSYSQFVHCEEWMRSSSRDFVKRLLGRNRFFESYFKAGFVERLIEDFFENRSKFRSNKLIASLVSFASFLECLEGIHPVSISSREEVRLEVL